MKNMNKQNTRTHDLDRLDESRFTAQTEEGEIRRKATLENVYEQSKDPYLERMRRELTKWVRKGLSCVPYNDAIPTLQQKMCMAEAEYHIQEIEKLIKKYASSDTFKKNIAQKVSKVSVDQANIIMKGDL